MNIGPLATKEFQFRMRGPRAFSLLTIYLGVLSGVALIMYLGASLAFEDIGGNRALGQPLYWLIIGMQVILVCFVAPAFTVGAISAERERGTFDLLRTTLLEPVEIAGGKFLAALGYVLIIVGCSLPLFGLAFTLGGVEPFQMVLSVWCVCVTAVSASALGLCISAHVRSTVNSAVVTYAVILSVLIGLPIMVLIVAGLLLPALPGSSASTAATGNEFLSEILVYVASLSPIGVFTGNEANYLTSGRVWSMTIPGSSQIFPAPFLVFSFGHLLASALLFWFTVRRLGRADKL